MTDDTAASTARVLPTGTVTFMRTDVEGSMRLMRDLGPGWDSVNAAHLAIIRRAVDERGGICVRTEGDAVFAVFPEARAGVAATVDAQRALASHDWPDGLDLRVRMGLHSGEAYLAGDDYGGFEVNRAARVAAAGHGGQVVLSDTTRALVADALPAGVGVRDLGRHALRGVPQPEQLFQLDIPGLPEDFPALRTVSSTIGDLPARLTSFIGRDDELAELADILSERRLVTLTGPGGIGKTSLAIEAARTVAERFRDGVWFVPLAELEDPGAVRSVIARVIGLFDGPGRPAADGLAPYLRDRVVLLILDNFERLLDASDDVANLLEASPASRMLVTSRAPLRIAGEQEYPVHPLGNECSRLFVDRAQAVRPGWDPGTETAAVDEVCALVDRLPLGVELVAARVAHLPIAALRDRLAARLPLPGPGPRNVPDRQRTLAGAIAWSHDLLPIETQRVLHDLAVFDGSFDLEQAERVVEPPERDGDVLEHLATLVDQSLLDRDAPDASGNGIRFRMLSTIRGFGQERLRDDDRVDSIRRRHAIAYLDLAEAAAPYIPGSDQPRRLDRLTVDYPNLISAMRWSIESGEPASAQRFVTAMWRFWQQTGRLVDGTELAEEALKVPDPEGPTARRMAALSAAGGIAYWHGRPSDAIAHWTDELAIALELGDLGGEADARWNLAFERYIAGDEHGALESSNQARRLFEQLGDERGAARVDWTILTIGAGSHPGMPKLDDLIALQERMERLDDPWYACQTAMSVAWVLLRAGEVPEASRRFTRALLASNALRDVTGTTIALPMAGLMANWAGRPEDAARLLGASDHLTELYGVKAPMGLRELLEESDPHVPAETALGPERYRQALEEGRQMTLDQAVALAARIQDEFWGPGE